MAAGDDGWGVRGNGRRACGNDVCCGEFRASPCSLRSRPPSRSEGGELLLVAPSGVAALCSAESCEGFGRVGDDSPFAFGGAVFGEGVGECVGFVGTLSAVTFDDFFGFE